MAINEWKIFKRVKGVEEAEEVKVKEDLDAVIEFLKEMDVQELTKRLEKMREMAEEEEVVEEEIKASNLKKQIKAFDEVLKFYEFFQDDVDVNGLRLGKIAKDLLRKAEKKKLKEVVKEKKKDIKWR